MAEAEIPEVRPKSGKLFHYTSSLGALGIIGQGCIRATDLSYLNDRRELFHGLDLFVRYAAEISPGFGALVAGHAMKLREEPLAQSRLAAACFCEQGTLLSQWRGYGKSSGYALGFDFDGLNSGPYPTERPTKVVYKTNEQEEVVSNFLDEAFIMWPEIEAVMQSSPKAPDDPGAEYRRVMTQFAENHMLPIWITSGLFKHPSFSEEDEWRIIHPMFWWKPGEPDWNPSEGHRQLKTEYRGGPMGITPFVSIPLKNQNGLMPLSDVIVGPGPNEQERCVAMKMLLSTHGYDVDAISVWTSGLPYRPS